MIRGASVYAPSDLYELYRDHLGRPITRESVAAIVTGIADRYQADGYARPRISVDDELAALGILRINVFEARIASVQIGGDPGPHRNRLERLAKRLEGGDALRQDALQDVLRRMRSLPGLTVTAATDPETDVPNVYRLDVDADYQPVDAQVRISNRGTDEVGPHIMIGQVVANALLAGRTSAGLLFAAAADDEELRGIGALTTTALGTEGAGIAFNAFRMRASPEETPEDLDFRYVRDRANLRFSHPVLADASGSASVSVELEATDLVIGRSDLALRDERLRMLEVAFTRTWRTGAAQYSGSIEAVKGLDGLNSGLVALDLTDDPRRADFLAWRLRFVRLARFTPSWSFRMDAFGQQSAYTLPYTERFKVGGERLGRGFEVAPIAGDRGIGAKLELRRDLSGAPALLGRASLYGFYDLGAVWRNDMPGRESAATAGFGFDVRSERASASLELAGPLTHPDVEGEDDPRLFFEVTLRL